MSFSPRFVRRRWRRRPALTTERGDLVHPLLHFGNRNGFLVFPPGERGQILQVVEQILVFFQKENYRLGFNTFDDLFGIWIECVDRDFLASY
jgi:hypothetical protein